jgi:hypothetical protein
MNTTRGKRFKFDLVLTALLLLSLTLILMGASPTTLASEARQAPQTVTVPAHGSTGEDVPLAGAQAWARAAVQIDSAPDDAVARSVRVKYHIAQARPGDLKVQLSTSGMQAAHTLWDRQSAEGDVLAESSDEIAAFQGAPVNGTWFLEVQGGDPKGYIDAFSIIVYYEMEMPLLQVEGEGEPGEPAFLRLPEGMTPVRPSPDEDEKPSLEGSSVVPQDVPGGATIIKTEDFEGAFPNGLWYPHDNSNDGYERYWDDAGCDPCGGDWAMWPADGGANRVDPCTPNDYPNNMLSWVEYGPFDLSDANNAGTEFVMWHDTEVDFDWVFFGVSHNGIDFYGWFFDGYNGCTRWNAYYPEFTGDPSVWVAWVFYSDASVRDRGAWVDDIVIWKEGNCDPVRVDAPPTADMGYDFDVDVVIENTANLGAFQFDLTYDGTCIEATGATVGPFLGSTGRSVVPVGPSFGAGVITFGASSYGSASGPSGTGVLATITFRAGDHQCCSDLHLQNVILTNTDGSPRCASLFDDRVCTNDPCPRRNCPEDLNCDGVINIIDIQMVAAKWNQHCPTR